MDSLFQLVDASLYAQLVDVLDASGGAVTYLQAFKDVRHAARGGAEVERFRSKPGERVDKTRNAAPRRAPRTPS